MVETLSVGQYQVEVNRRKGLRGMNLSVKPDGQVRIRCNTRRPKADIEDFILSSADFIARRLEQIRELDSQHPRREFVSNEQFLWMGSPLKLDVIWSWNKRIKIRRIETGLEMLAPVVSTPAERLKALIEFYREEARAWFEARVGIWSRITGFEPKSLSVRGQRTLWGSCTSDGALSLNWKLMCCPAEVIDYVVLHELCHLREQNHSVRFWSLVERFMPDYKKHRKWLAERQQEIARQFMLKYPQL
jgi:predicted metal-dependent hydrolase